MMHLTTHRLVSIFHYSTGTKNLQGVADIAHKILESRGLKPWSLEIQYSTWHSRNWFYKKLLWFLKPEFMKDENVLSPEALEIERKLTAKRNRGG
jgi:hypothetical protein